MPQTDTNPEAVLWEMRAVAAACLRPDADRDTPGQQADRAAALADLFVRLDDELCRGGNLPDPWRRGRTLPTAIRRPSTTTTEGERP